MFSAAAIAVGLASLVLLSSPAELDAEFDAELTLPLLSSELLPPVLVAFVLAGLFASTMSTADSQILSCSAALTQDLFPKWRQSYTMAKVGTVLMTAIVLLIAVAGSGNVFWVYADSCGLKTAFLCNGGRKAATIFSLRYSSSR